MSVLNGLHITCLTICTLINLVPDMVKAGRVFIAESALYGYYNGNKDFIPAWTKEDIPKGTEFTRFKGLGELNPNQLYAMFMDKRKRRLIKVEYPESLSEFNNLMSNSKSSLIAELGLNNNMLIGDDD